MMVIGKFVFRLMNYQVADCTCGGMASYANCTKLPIALVVVWPLMQIVQI
jgi:hypothetical protein